MRSTSNLVCGLPVSKGRTLLILGHIGHGHLVWFNIKLYSIPYQIKCKYFKLHFTNIPFHPMHVYLTKLLNINQ